MAKYDRGLLLRRPFQLCSNLGKLIVDLSGCTVSLPATVNYYRNDGVVSETVERGVIFQMGVYGLLHSEKRVGNIKGL